MQQDKDRSVTQAARLDDLLARHVTSKSLAKEAVTGTVATVAGFAHVGASGEVVKNVAWSGVTIDYASWISSRLEDPQ